MQSAVLSPQHGGCIKAAPLKLHALLYVGISSHISKRRTTFPDKRVEMQWSAVLTLQHVQLGTHLNAKFKISRIVFEIPSPASYLKRPLFCDGNGEPCVGEFAIKLTVQVLSSRQLPLESSHILFHWMSHCWRGSSPAIPGNTYRTLLKALLNLSLSLR